MWQLNFVVAYLNSNIDFDIYILQPKGLTKREDNMVWKFYKTLYDIM